MTTENNSGLAISHVNKGLHRAIEVLAITLMAFVGFEGLIKIENLYQPILFIQLSGIIYLILFIWMHFLFDLHFRKRQPFVSMVQQIKGRFEHFLVWENFRHFQNYLVLPGTIYWGSVVLIGINFGHHGLQQAIAVCSSLGLICTYAFFGKLLGHQIDVSNEVEFLILTYVKIYSAWLLFAGSLGITWYYCFPQSTYYLTVFMVSFILLYQALFLFHATSFWNVLRAAGIALIVTAFSVVVFHVWNVNYFTAGLFLTAIYNFLWTLLFHSIRRTLTPAVIIEQLAFLALMLIMVFGATNFRERIDRCA